MLLVIKVIWRSAEMVEKSPKGEGVHRNGGGELQYVGREHQDGGGEHQDGGECG